MNTAMRVCLALALCAAVVSGAPLSAAGADESAGADASMQGEQAEAEEGKGVVELLDSIPMPMPSSILAASHLVQVSKDTRVKKPGSLPHHMGIPKLRHHDDVVTGNGLVEDLGHVVSDPVPQLEQQAVPQQQGTEQAPLEDVPKAQMWEPVAEEMAEVMPDLGFKPPVAPIPKVKDTSSYTPSPSSSPQPSGTPSTTASPSPSKTPTISPSPKGSLSPSPAPSSTESPSPSPSPTTTESPSMSPTAAESTSPAASSAPSESPSPPPSESSSTSVTPSTSFSPSFSPSFSLSLAPTDSPSSSFSPSPSLTTEPSISPTTTVSPSLSPDPSESPRPSSTPSVSITPSNSQAPLPPVPSAAPKEPLVPTSRTFRAHPMERKMYTEETSSEWSYAPTSEPWVDTCRSYPDSSQSPIDLVQFRVASQMDPLITPVYDQTQLLVRNTGNYLRVLNSFGSTVHFGDRVYELMYMQVHTPSEHRMNGEQFPVELQWYHRSPEDGSMAAVSLLYKVGVQPNEFLQTIIDNVPAKGEDRLTLAAVDLNSALPVDITQYKSGTRVHYPYYSYDGSLTTPPCTQGVRWFVWSKPDVLTQAQADSLSSIFEDAPTRPGGVQAVNGRIVQLKTLF